MTEDEQQRDTQPPEERPSLDEILTEQTTRFVRLVAQVIDPVRTTLQHLVDDVLKLRHEVRERLADHERRLMRLEGRVEALEDTLRGEGK